MPRGRYLHGLLLLPTHRGFLESQAHGVQVVHSCRLVGGRRQMLVRNAVASAQIEGIRPDEARLQIVVQQASSPLATDSK